MADGITLRATPTLNKPPDKVKQVVDMVRSLSNKYVPTPLLDKVEIDLLQSLKDFRHRVRKCAATVKLRKGTIDAYTKHLLSPMRTARPSDNASDISSWHKAEQPEESDPNRYGLDSDLYDAISALLEVNSGKKQLEHFLDKLEMEFVNSIKAL
jgi:hypothetical protein